MSKLIVKKWVFAVLLVGCWTWVASGEVINLRNGRSIEGKIIKREAGKIFVDMGVGSVTLRESQVASIEKGDNAAIEDKWKRRYFAHEKYLPEDLKELARAYRDLEKFRDHSLKASPKMKKLKDQVAAAIKLQGSVNDQLSSVEIQMANKNLGRDVTAYNALVNRQNQLVVKYRTAQKQAKGAQKQLESFQVDVSTYMLELPRYETRFEKHRDADKGTEEKRRMFYEEVARNLVDFQKDYEDFVMPHEQMGGHKILIAELNGSIKGRFLLDTGASFVTISEAMAERMKLPFKSGEKMEVSLADGSKIMTHGMTLDSVQIGDARVDHVGCVVTPKPPSDNIDGLLGMSFLKEFMIQIDPVSNELILKKFSD